MTSAHETDYNEYSVAHGLRRDDFDHLSKDDKRKIIKLISQISESSFRRGFQHGDEITKRRDTVCPVRLRFETPLNISPFTDAFYEDGEWASTSGFTAVERLSMEHRVLVELFGHDAFEE